MEVKKVSLIKILEIAIGILLVLMGIMAVESKKLINSVIYLSLMSMLAVIAFVVMRAPDVAITEAVIGSGLVTALFIFTLFSTQKVGDK